MPRDIHRDGGGGGGDGGGGPVLLLAGLADLALSTCGSALKAAGGLLGRSDIGALAAEGRQDLQARGRLALGRLTLDHLGSHGPGAGGEAHMEILARHAHLHARRRGPDGGAGV
ncbi:hypothetical protein [Streptomyces sp. S4.7]|uniref:hypothetical protein n=1 Tax=Streptomyces sp. S4.7 TaxID=2705439 RepID=UPI0013D9C82F|nr:hypothetical protein [Streptomyces sp. S4.7]